MSTMSEADLDEVMLALREGAQLHVGGSRCHCTYGYEVETGEWYCEDFDEGATQMREISEEGIRRVAAGAPDRCEELLRWRRRFAR